MATTNIEYAHYTHNPWWGCRHASPGCDNCYAEELAANPMYWKGPDLWDSKHVRRTLSDNYWKQPHIWNKKAADLNYRPRVMCGSMCDIFDPHGLPDQRERLWDTIEETGNLDWLLVTKRPENILSMVPRTWTVLGPGNVILVFTAENQKWLNARWKHVRQVRSFFPHIAVSYEPALEPIDLMPLKAPGLWKPSMDADNPWKYIGPTWFIAGGESGDKARPSHPQYFTKLRDQCGDLDIAFYFKQWGTYHPNFDKDPAIWDFGEIPLLPDGSDCRGVESLADREYGCVLMQKHSKKFNGRLLEGAEHNEGIDSRGKRITI